MAAPATAFDSARVNSHLRDVELRAALAMCSPDGRALPRRQLSKVATELDRIEASLSLCLPIDDILADGAFRAARAALRPLATGGPLGDDLATRLWNILGMLSDVRLLVADNVGGSAHSLPSLAVATVAGRGAWVRSTILAAGSWTSQFDIGVLCDIALIAGDACTYGRLAMGLAFPAYVSWLRAQPLPPQ